MGGSQPSTTTQITKNEPWDQAKPFYEGLYGRAQEALQATNKNPFTGDFIATDKAAGGNIGAGLDILKGNVTGGKIGAGADVFQQMAIDTASGKYLDPASNPFIKGAVDASLRPVTEQLTNQVLPQVRDRSVAEGAYGGARQDLQENDAMTAWQRDAGDISSKIYADNYARERQNQLGSGELLTQSYDLFRQPGLEMMKIGDVQKQQKQAEYDNAYQKFLEKKQAPWYGLGEMAQILGSGGFRTTTATGTAQQGGDSTGSWVQAGIGGASALASLLKVLPMFAAASDENLKTDIKKVGDGPLGVPIYAYRYKDDPKTYPKVVGAMAQDIEKLVPEAVWEIGGKKVVSAPVLSWFNDPANREAA